MAECQDVPHSNLPDFRIPDLPVSLAPRLGSVVDRHVTLGKDGLMGLFFSIRPCGHCPGVEDSVGALCGGPAALSARAQPTPAAAPPPGVCQLCTPEICQHSCLFRAWTLWGGGLGGRVNVPCAILGLRFYELVEAGPYLEFNVLAS